MEKWLPVPGYEGLYQVSDRGRVWSEPRTSGGKKQGRRYREGRFLKPLVGKSGYLKYGLAKDGVSRQHLAHTLVLTAFVGPRPPGLEACHNDGNILNCTPENLRWDTHSANLYDKVKHGTDFQASKTHCTRRHRYSEANTYRGKTGRMCRACLKAHNRLCRGKICRHASEEFAAAADWYYRNPVKRWRSNTGSDRRAA